LERNVPTFAVGVTDRGPYRTGLGEIGLPNAINGTVIEPGDLILGDLNGVVSVPRMDAHDILRLRSRSTTPKPSRWPRPKLVL
jgi:regulator of RNase E activity RraA